MRHLDRFVVLTLIVTFALTGVSAAEGYKLPPKEVVDIVTAPPAPRVSFSPDHRWMIYTHRAAMPSIEDLSRRMLRLGGTRIDPAANSSFQTTFGNSFEVRERSTGKVLKRVEMRDGHKLSTVSWSHTSEMIAWIEITPKGSKLSTMRLDDPEAVRTQTRPLATVLSSIEWMPDGEGILAPLVPRNRGAEPAMGAAPGGPNIQESIGNTSPTRTYQDLLTNPYDEALFDYYATSQLALVGADGSLREIGKPGLHSFEISPNGEELLVYTIKRPYSYLQAYWSFPKTIAIWDMKGRPLFTVAEKPLAENIPIGGVEMGRRDVEWMANRGATLVWVEALDGGDPKREVEHRDQLFTLASPYDAEPMPLLEVEHRYSRITAASDPSKIMISEYDRDRRWVRTLLHTLNSDEGPKVLEDRSLRDRYGDPGRVLTTTNDQGQRVPIQQGDWIYRSGRGASPEGDLPFLDRQNLLTLETQRLWRCEPGTYESAVDIIPMRGDALPQLMTVSETTTTPPNYQLRDLKTKSSAAVTDFPDPTPQIRGVKKQLVTYEREDGVPLSATLYLPADYKEGQKLPLLIWAYPREFNDVKTAGQVSGSDSRFTRIAGSSHLTLLTQGYAVMDAATMPVIGDAETMNNTFIDQIVAAAQAAIDKAVEMGVADGKHVAVGGHSYGAFMTANLLAHSDLFQAGLARSGAYNRTLTPFGFQAERRALWEAKDVYYGISPFLHANKIKAPILLVHGEADNNSGTFPIQSKRMYQAIKGNGGTVRLVMLPNESHGYRALESVLHVQAEMIEWFDRFLKETP
jgi:dipeptidyl aminopeptidase/acylaminoacyl peptidase